MMHSDQQYKDYHLLYFLCRTKQTTHYLVKKEKPLPIIGPIPSQLNPKNMYATMIKWQSQHRKCLHQQWKNLCHQFAVFYIRCNETVQGLTSYRTIKYMIDIPHKWHRWKILMMSFLPICVSHGRGGKNCICISLTCHVMTWLTQRSKPDF